MKILQFSAQNFMRLEAVEINPDDNTVLITGPNGAGKSSVLKGLVALFCGKKHWPEMPIKEGQDSAVLEARTEEFIAKLTIRKNGKNSLEVKPIDGKTVYKAPQDFFNSIRDKFAFNPLKFAQEEPKKQRVILMGMVGLNFDDIRTKYVQCQQERSAINSNKGLLQKQFDALVVPDNTPDKEVSCSDLAKQLQEASEFNNELKVRHRGLDIELVNLENVKAHITNAQNNISRLEKETQLAHECLAGAISSQKNLFIKINLLRESTEGVDFKNTSDITTHIQAAEITNTAVNLKQNKKILESAIEAKSTEYVELGYQMKDLEAEKAERLSKAKMPVEGLSVSGDSVLYEGIPLSQVNTAKALEICIAISMALNPELRVLWGNANDLDDNSLEIIKKIAADKDYQLWLEKMDTTGKIGFYIEEGILK